MKRFKEYLLERRDKSDPHEKNIRALATLGRLDHKYHSDPETYMAQYPPPPKLDTKSKMTSRTHYGECDSVSHCVANRLRHQYPSTKVVYSQKYGQKYPDDPGLEGHSWVEIPETGHYIDPSHDMFRIHGSRTNIPRKSGLFPNSAVKIGKIGDKYHKANYSTERNIDKNWKPGKRKDNG